MTICGNDINNLPVDLTGVGITTATTAGDTKMDITFTTPDPLVVDALPNFAKYRIVLSPNIHDAGGASIQAGTGGLSRILTALQGDAAAGGDRRVNATDLGLVRCRVGQDARNILDPVCP